MFFTSDLTYRAKKILDLAKAENLRIVTAESCTGGLLSALFTEIAGSSEFLERGFVSYSNQSKIEMLDVKKDDLDNHGAVSEEVARAMVKGALKNSQAKLAISITGIAGPDGGTEKKPVGLVYIGIGTKEKTQVRKFNFSGLRSEVRKATLVASLSMIENFLNTDRS